MISLNLLGLYALSDEFKWWGEMDEDPDHEFKVVPYEESYFYQEILRLQSTPMKVYLDLDTRTSVIEDMLQNSRTNIPYIIRIARKLSEKCRNQDRLELSRRITIAINNRARKEEEKKLQEEKRKQGEAP